jgi:hypothetical protein
VDEYVVGGSARSAFRPEHVPVIRRVLERRAQHVFVVLIADGLLRVSFHLRERSSSAAREEGERLISEALAEAGSPPADVQVSVV